MTNPTSQNQKQLTAYHISCDLEFSVHKRLRDNVQMIPMGPRMSLSDVCSSALRVVFDLTGWQQEVLALARESAIKHMTEPPQYKRIPIHESVVEVLTQLRDQEKRLGFTLGQLLSAATERALQLKNAEVIIRTRVLTDVSSPPSQLSHS